MRVSLVISSMQAGGAERVMSIMANHWAENGWTVTLLTQETSGTQPFYNLVPQVDYKPLGLAEPSGNIFAVVHNNWRRLTKLRAAVVAAKTDVVVSFVDKTNVLVLLALARTGIPVVVSEHSDPSQYRIGFGWSLLRRVTYRYAREVVVLTADAGRALPFVKLSRKSVIPNPVLPAHGSGADPDNVPWSRPVVLAMGRLAPEKGFDILVRAFAKVHAGHPDWSLVIIGEGPLRRELSSLAASLGVDDKVELIGRLSNPEELLPRGDIFVLSSRYEGWGMALCEAMAAGLPVISTDCPSGPRDIITPEIDGVLVPTEDPSALADALERMTSNSELRERLGRNARSISDRFSVGRVMAKWEALLVDIVNDVHPIR